MKGEKNAAVVGDEINKQKCKLDEGKMGDKNNEYVELKTLMDDTTNRRDFIRNTM